MASARSRLSPSRRSPSASRGVGKLVGLEVFAKEIATATQGLSWMPPLLVSQARLAMIFAFRKQYFVDLSRMDEANIEQQRDGRYKVFMPVLEGDLHLIDVSPYDIQDGRVLGLLDVIPMNASRQGCLMEAARGQAAELYDRNDEKYLADARRSIERHLRSLLRLFDIEIDLVWPDAPSRRIDDEPAHTPGHGRRRLLIKTQRTANCATGGSPASALSHLRLVRECSEPSAARPPVL